MNHERVLATMPHEKWITLADVKRTLATDVDLTQEQYTALALRLAWMMTPANVDLARVRKWNRSTEV